MRKEPLTIENLELNVNDQTLILGGNVSIPAGMKSALVGRNGSGKSTLLRTITARLSGHDLEQHVHIGRGSIEAPLDAAVVYIPQDPVLPDATVSSYIGAPSPSARQIWERFAADIGIYELMQRNCQDLSGGQKMKVSLARAVATGANFLLFDEPTNNLDNRGIDSLARWLKKWPGTAIVVSHDRDFLDDTVSQVIEIDEETKQLRTYGGDYSFYREKKDEEFASAEKMYLQERSDRERLEADARKKLTMTRGAENVSTNSYVRSRMAKFARRAKTQLGRIERDLSKRTMPREPRQPRFIVPVREIPEYLLLRLTNFTYTYPKSKTPVLNYLNVSVYGGEHILLQGDNGSGKSTLLRILADEGGVWRAPNVRIVWCTQNTLDLAGFKDIFAYAADHGIKLSAAEIRTIIGAALNRDIGSGKTERLSIGERQRVALALLFAADPDVILLDEPTNHLDLTTIELLEETLSKYRGAVIIATHDRRFVHNFMPDRIWHLYAGALQEEAGAVD